MNLLAAVVLAASATLWVHLPVSTNVPQAQADFDRGLFLYYAYDGDEAVPAFRQAAQLDRRLGMAYWGIALGSGPDLNTAITQDRFVLAADAVKKAAMLQTDASPLERKLIAVMALRYRGSFSDWNTDDASYRHAMLELADKSGNETVQLLTAEALLEHGGLSWNGDVLSSDESRKALALVSNVLRRDPSSVMANHLCIHLYDLAENRAAALPCAQRLDAVSFPPEAEHLAHMPAHYWIETGNYAAALRSSERAYALLNQIPSDDGGSAHRQRYTKHDVAVGYSAAMMLGSYADALRWSERMNAAFDTSFDAITALRFGRYKRAYDAADDQYGADSVRGLAALHLNHLNEARSLASRLGPINAKQGYLPQIFLAELADAQGKYAEAEHWIAQARAIQRNSFSAELVPLVPADETLGALRLRRGDAAGAVAAFTAALTAYPNDPRARFGLAQALAAGGNTSQAANARARFEREWEGADTNVTNALPYR